MSRHIASVIERWFAANGLEGDRPPEPGVLERISQTSSGQPALRDGVPLSELRAWEKRHGFRLPEGLRTWLELSDGFYSDLGPMVHPLRSIGPMVAFAQVPDLKVQPESWFEIGNPGLETVCIDLAYSWPGPGGGCPLFTSGDDLRGTRPRLIARSFVSWFAEVLRGGARAYWLDRSFRPLGDPWQLHRLHAPAPRLPARLRRLASLVKPLMSSLHDEAQLASQLGISRGDVELLFRHLQHHHPT